METWAVDIEIFDADISERMSAIRHHETVIWNELCEKRWVRWRLGFPSKDHRGKDWWRGRHDEPEIVKIWREHWLVKCNNREKVKAYHKAWVLSHREQVRLNKKAWRKARREKGIKEPRFLVGDYLTKSLERLRVAGAAKKARTIEDRDVSV
jgi:hypothetical protein